MTLRERIEAVFRGERPDAMVWFGDLTYWYGTHQQIGDLPERWRGPRGIGRMHRELNVGEYVPGCCAYATVEGDRVRHESRTEDGVRTSSWHTPVGSLHEHRAYSPASHSWGYTEHAVKGAADLRVVRYIMEHRRHHPCPEAVATIDRDYAEFGLPIVAVPASPLSELNKAWTGVMALAYLMADEPREMRMTLDAMAESQQRLYTITAECDCPYAMVCENLSGETMGGYFDEHCAPFLSAQVDYLHGYGKQVLIHVDGTLRGVLGKVRATGVDCLDAVTPAPVGDVAVDELRNLAGDDVLILGGLPGAMFAPPFTAREIEQHVKEIIRVHKDSGTFMFGVADQVPPNGDWRLVRLVSDLVEEYGRY